MGEVYIEKYTKLLGLIELGVVYEKQDKTTMWQIFHMWSTPKMKVRSCDWSDPKCFFFIKTKHDNYMADRIDMIYAKNDFELSWSIWPGAICHENQIEQWHDRLYRCSLHQKQHWIVMTDWTWCRLWQKTK